MNTPSETSELLENKAAMITVQRITVVISRRRKTCAREGDGTGAVVSDIRAKIAGMAPVANSQLAAAIHLTILNYEPIFYHGRRLVPKIFFPDWRKEWFLRLQ
jgi:hypothetical protein